MFCCEEEDMKERKVDDAALFDVAALFGAAALFGEGEATGYRRWWFKADVDLFCRCCCVPAAAVGWRKARKMSRERDGRGCRQWWLIVDADLLCCCYFVPAIAPFGEPVLLLFDGGS
ncbi:hypothetical protein SLEP1_g23758 [Rubroshorea leprosula]|uniref:Uncharacterized protein n=1 Tax=Rubroshorea leprosula TaxID=152421 RepID=A0AAV5JIL2_9ROSI|nr:hypothetical protein SLEP1_g23758 [Rubroshorea leprosula]